MDIERVNEHTLKFFITYRDIERRGFEKEEIWYNRERGEELFWEMMDEAHQQEEFPLEGPLWIQVQALDKGLEILVTRAALSSDGSKLELPISEEKSIDMPVEQNIDKLLDHDYSHSNYSDNDHDEDDVVEEDQFLSFVIGFRDFEDLISLSHAIETDEFLDSVYSFEGKYYLNVVFHTDAADEKQDNILSQLLEYGFESTLTIHRIQEYGKVIIEENALQTIQQYFSKRG